MRKLVVSTGLDAGNPPKVRLMILYSIEGVGLGVGVGTAMTGAGTIVKTVVATDPLALAVKTAVPDKAVVVVTTTVASPEALVTIELA